MKKYICWIPLIGVYYVIYKVITYKQESDLDDVLPFHNKFLYVGSMIWQCISVIALMMILAFIWR